MTFLRIVLCTIVVNPRFGWLVQARQTLPVYSGNPVNSAAMLRPSISSSPEGRVLFGSLTCPMDKFSVDQMLPHQLHQSANRPFDHRILFVDSATDQATAEQRSSHAAMLSQLRSKQVVDEMVDLKDLKLPELNKGVLSKKIEKVLGEQAWHSETAYNPAYNLAQVAFLAKCLDGGYDHCAWLDSDIFVHKGTVPWVDGAIQRQSENPQDFVAMFSNPSLGDDSLIKGFSSRYFVYHKEGLRHLLPLKGSASLNQKVQEEGGLSWEDLVSANVKDLSASEMSISQLDTLVHSKPDMAKMHRDRSWMIHPPDFPAEQRILLKACKGQGLSALIAIVSQGSDHGEAASEWRSEEDKEIMDKAKWFSHIQHYCNDHLQPLPDKSFLADTEIAAPA